MRDRGGLRAASAFATLPLDQELPRGEGSTVPYGVDATLADRIHRHYRRCEAVLAGLDVDGFMDWLGPEATFPTGDGTVVRASATRPFWEWRFANTLEFRRCEITIESIAWTGDDTIVVDFHEVDHTVVRGSDGQPVERNADLHNRNWWRVTDDRLTAIGGAELVTRRTLDGVEYTDDAVDPLGFTAWRRYQEGRKA